MLETLDAAAVRRWCATGLAGLRSHEHEINQLNVYPVPDGDTGTNLVLTLAAAEQAMAPDRCDPQAGLPEVLRALARGALLGARGNSGVIVAQLFRGLADSLGDAPAADGRALAKALSAAAKSGYVAVADPVEGTILSVATAAAHAALAADTADLAMVATAAADAAADALARTPGQLPVLASAGVVDAGGRGLLVLLDALVAVVTGAAPERPDPLPDLAGHAAVKHPVTGPPPAPHPEPASSAEVAEYEVQYLLAGPDEAVARLRTVLGGLGDSLVVTGTGDGVWKVHVHVRDAGAAIEAGVAAGRLSQITVTPLAVEAAPAGARPRGAVAVAAGEGLVELLGAEGAVVVGNRPSTGQLLAAIRSTGAEQVVVLPNYPHAHAVAAAAAAAAGPVQVRVVPTRSPVQALAALAVREPGRPFDDDVIAMAEAAGACRAAEVCLAHRDALTVAGRCRAGDVLALVDGEVHLIGEELTTVCQQLLDRLLGGGGELVSLLLGEQAPSALAPALRSHLARRWPFVEVQVHDAGQPDYPLVVGVE